MKNVNHLFCNGLILFLFLLNQNLSTSVIAQAPSPTGSTLELLFEAEFWATGEVKPYVVSDDIWNMGFSMQRDLIAQGEGTFTGPRLRGTLDWSKLARKYKEHTYSSTLVAGWMEIDDGAEVMYEARGFAVPDPLHPNRWVYTGALRFEEPDAPYEWLAGVIAVWEGVFDVETGKAQYRAYIPVHQYARTTT